MTFPAKVILSFLAAFVLAAALLFSAALSGVRRVFAQTEERQVAAAFENLRRELDRGAEDAARRVGLVADSEATTRMVLDLSRAQPDFSVYANDASGAARTHGLEMFEFVMWDGTVISSTPPLPAIGAKEDWVAAAAQSVPEGRAILRLVGDPNQPEIARLAVRTLSVGDKKLYAVGGSSVDHRLLAGLPLGPGMRALLFVNPGGKCAGPQGTDATGATASPGPAEDFLAQMCRNPAAVGLRHICARKSSAGPGEAVAPVASVP